MKAASLRTWFFGVPLQRIRFLFLALTLVSAVVTSYRLRTTPSLNVRLTTPALAALLLLVIWWTWGYRRQHVPAIALPMEGLALLSICIAFGGPLPLFGLLYVSLSFRSLYGDGTEGVLPTAIWGLVLAVSFALTRSFTAVGIGITGVQTPAVLLNGLVMWLLGWSLKERERWFARERELMQERALEAQDKARALVAVNVLKDRLIENLSHELRTPLAAIRSYSELLLDYRDPAVQDEFVSIINSESKRLSRLLDDVLDLSKIESGTFMFRMAEIDVVDLCREAEQSYRPLIERRGLEFGIEVGGGLQHVQGDHDRLLQVLANLLSNALKFTDEGDIILGARQVGDSIELSVADRGIGVPEHERERIFERFHQAGSALAGRPQGTGLGLAICREIVEHHSGRIGVADRPGGGSIFTLALPASPLKPA